MGDNFEEEMKALEQEVKEEVANIDKEMQNINSENVNIMNENNYLNARESNEEKRFETQLSQAKEDYARRNGTEMRDSWEKDERARFENGIKAEFENKINQNRIALNANNAKIGEMQYKKTSAYSRLTGKIDSKISEVQAEFDKKSDEVNKLRAEKMRYFRDSANNPDNYANEAMLEKAEDELKELQKKLDYFTQMRGSKINDISNILGYDFKPNNSKSQNNRNKQNDQTQTPQPSQPDQTQTPQPSQPDQAQTPQPSQPDQTQTNNGNPAPNRNDASNGVGGAGVGNPAPNSNVGKDDSTIDPKNVLGDDIPSIEIRNGNIYVSTPEFGKQKFSIDALYNVYDKDHSEDYDYKTNAKHEDLRVSFKEEYSNTRNNLINAISKPGTSINTGYRDLLEMVNKVGEETRLKDNGKDYEKFSSYTSRKKPGFDTLIAKAIQMYEFKTVNKIATEGREQDCQKLIETMKNLRESYDDTINNQAKNENLKISYDVKDSGTLGKKDFAKLKESARSVRDFATVIASLSTKLAWKMEEALNKIKNKSNPRMGDGSKTNTDDTDKSDSKSTKNDKKKKDFDEDLKDPDYKKKWFEFKKRKQQKQNNRDNSDRNKDTGDRDTDD